MSTSRRRSAADDLLMTNLTGHPSVVLPNGFRGDGTPTSITFVGRLFGEEKLLALAKAYQDATSFHLKHPPLDEMIAKIATSRRVSVPAIRARQTGCSRQNKACPSPLPPPTVCR